MTGILFGLGAATLQSLSYLFSRAFLNQPAHSPWLLLCISHTLMGIMSLLLLPLVWQDGFKPGSAVFLNAIGAGGFYLIGQMGLFRALRHLDASRVAPLLGAKILFLAFVTVVFGGERLSGWQWLSAFLAVGGVFILNDAGGRIPLRGLLAMGFVITGYSLSDLSIVRLVDATGLNNWHASLSGALLTYLICGIWLAPFLYFQPAARRRRTWQAAVPYSILWFAALILLYACFAEAGAVLGNIIQSTRGLISIGLGILAVRLGWHNLERQTGKRVMLKRLAGALAMTTAIFLYLKP